MRRTCGALSAAGLAGINYYSGYRSATTPPSGRASSRPKSRECPKPRWIGLSVPRAQLHPRTSTKVQAAQPLRHRERGLVRRPPRRPGCARIPSGSPTSRPCRRGTAGEKRGCAGAGLLRMVAARQLRVGARYSKRSASSMSTSTHKSASSKTADTGMASSPEAGTYRRLKQLCPLQPASPRYQRDATVGK